MRLRSVAVAGANRELANRDGVFTPSLGSLAAVVSLSEPKPMVNAVSCVVLGNENKLVRVQYDAGKLGQPRVFNEVLALL